MSLVTFQDATGVRVATVESNEIELGNSPEVREQLERGLLDCPPHVAIDLTRVQYVDSSGLGLLAVIVKKIKRYSGRLALVGVNPAVQKILKMTRMDQAVEIYADLTQVFENKEPPAGS